MVTTVHAHPEHRRDYKGLFLFNHDKSLTQESHQADLLSDVDSLILIINSEFQATNDFCFVDISLWSYQGLIHTYNKTISLGHENIRFAYKLEKPEIFFNNGNSET